MAIDSTLHVHLQKIHALRHCLLIKIATNCAAIIFERFPVDGQGAVQRVFNGVFRPKCLFLLHVANFKHTNSFHEATHN